MYVLYMYLTHIVARQPVFQKSGEVSHNIDHLNCHIFAPHFDSYKVHITGECGQ